MKIQDGTTLQYRQILTPLLWLMQDQPMTVTSPRLQFRLLELLQLLKPSLEVIIWNMMEVMEPIILYSKLILTPMLWRIQVIELTVTSLLLQFHLMAVPLRKYQDLFQSMMKIKESTTLQYMQILTPMLWRIQVTMMTVTSPRLQFRLLELLQLLKPSLEVIIWNMMKIKEYTTLQSRQILTPMLWRIQELRLTVTSPRLQFRLMVLVLLK